MEQDDVKIQTAVEAGVVTTDETLEEVVSSNRLLSENAIPIPNAMKDIVNDRVKDGTRVAAIYHKDWKKSIKEFTETGTYTDNENVSNAPHENLVRSTVETLVDYSYMTNPDVHITRTSVEDEDGAERSVTDTLNAALSTLINKKAEPGINLKAKMTKMIVYSHLTNFGIVRLDFQDEKGSLEETIKTYNVVTEKIKKEKDLEKLQRLYELLDITQKELIYRRRFGISLTNRNPFNIIIDPNTTMADLSDAKWLIEFEHISIAFIKAEYMKYLEEEDKFVFRYDENTEFETQNEASDDNPAVQTPEQIVDELMPDMEKEHAEAITKDTIRCVTMYDRVTRRVYKYIYGRYDTPLWVYEDDIKLSRFFPFFVLPFSTILSSVMQRSEVSRYINFQTEINDINDQISQTRRAAARIMLYNSTKIDSEEVDRVLTEVMTPSSKMKAIGVKLRDNDKPLNEILEPFKMPISNFAETFDVSDLRQAIERSSRVSDALRGNQFKSNTTDDAVQTYNNFAQTRMEGVTDKIEETVEEIMWAICEVIMSKMTKDTIAELVPQDLVEFFEPMSVEDFNQQFSLAIAAGSTEKPTSLNKRKEAFQIIQMLGQFGTAAPMTVLGIVSRLLRRVFGRDMVSNKELESLQAEGQAFMQKGVSQPNQSQKPPQTQKENENV